MGNYFGAFEKSLLGILLLFIGIYLACDYYFPSIINPELRELQNNPESSLSLSPRKGQVFAPGEISFSSSDATLDGEGNFVNHPDISHLKVDQRNLFAQSVDGQHYPSNAYLLGFSPFYTKKFWLPLLAVSMRIAYQRDDENTPTVDIWQTSIDTYLKMYGDCEDEAILLADWLIDLGYDARVVAGKLNGQGHAWVVLYKDGKEYLLEATDKGSKRRYPLVALHPEYEATYMFNKDHFWMMYTENRGWKNRLATKGWLRLSDFR